MTRGMTALCVRRGDLSREGEGNRSDITGLIFRLEEVDTICFRLSAEAEALRFDLRSKGEVEAYLRRALEYNADRRGIIKAEART